MRYLLLFFFILIIDLGLARSTEDSLFLSRLRDSTVHLNVDFALAEDTFGYDTSILDTRKFNTEQMYDYRSSKDFIYDRKPIGDNIFDLIGYWIADLFRSFFGEGSKELNPNAGIFAMLINVLIYGLAGLAVIAIIWHFLGLELNTVIGKRSAQIVFEEEKESIHEIDFEKRITDALESKDYRFALRYLYLQLLKNLADKDLLHWTLEKTNYDYITELKHSYREPFSNITKRYEKAWYGYHLVRFSDFEETKILVESFKKELQS